MGFRPAPGDRPIIPTMFYSRDQPGVDGMVTPKFFLAALLRSSDAGLGRGRREDVLGEIVLGAGLIEFILGAGLIEFIPDVDVRIQLAGLLEIVDGLAPPPFQQPGPTAGRVYAGLEVLGLELLELDDLGEYVDSPVGIPFLEGLYSQFVFGLPRVRRYKGPPLVRPGPPVPLAL